MRKGLSRERIVEAALEMIAEDGLDAFSLRELATRLDVRPASLYNHVASIDDLYTAIAVAVMQELHKTLAESIQGLSGDEAVRAIALAYYRYGKEHPDHYKTIIALRKAEGEALRDAFQQVLMPFYKVLNAYGLCEAETIAMHRMLRSLIHGYLTLEEAGYFSHPLISPEDSFVCAVESMIVALHKNAEPEEGGAAHEYTK